MAVSNFGEDLGSPRLTAGREFLRLIRQAEDMLYKLNRRTDELLVMRQMVQDNDPPIFEDGDLQYVNAQLIELRTAIRAHANGLP